jgi:hypothetical protein
MDNLDSAPTQQSMEEVNQKNKDQVAFEVLYETFTAQEKAALDQWYKWTPEKWLTKDRMRTAQISVKERYKAWQIALAGLMKDWMTEEDFPGKYSFLLSILQEFEKVKPEEKIQPELHKDPDMPKSKVDEIRINSESESDQSNIIQYSLRKKRRIIEDDAEAEQLQEEPFRKSNRKTTPSKQSKKAVNSAKNTLVAQPTLEFERLCRNAEIGVSKSNSTDRIKILFFLVHSCVEPSVNIHSYIDQCIEKIAQIKRNQRALIKDRKIMYVICDLTNSRELREGFNKRDKQKLKELGVSNGAAENNEVPNEGLNNDENVEESVIDGSERIDDDMIEDSEKPDDSAADASDRPEEDDADNDSEYIFLIDNIVCLKRIDNAKELLINKKGKKKRPKGLNYGKRSRKNPNKFKKNSKHMKM